MVPQLRIMRYFHHFSLHGEAVGFEKCNNADRNNREIHTIDLLYIK